MIREAKLPDARAIAETHVASWKTTYVGQIPSDYLAGLSVPARENAWRESFTFAGRKILVAGSGALVKGFVSFGPSRDSDVDSSVTGEVYAIYLRAEYQRQGIGKQLWNSAIKTLQADKFKAVTLWVLDTNAETRKFYEKMGCTLDGATKPAEIAGQKLLELRYRINVRS